jgi:hypothetical protein
VVIRTGLEQDRSQEALEVPQHIGRKVEFDPNNNTLSPSKECSALDECFSDLTAFLPYKNEQMTQNLDVRPGHSKTTEGIYATVAERVILHYQTLELLRNCSLGCRVLEIPSWALGWSSQWQELWMGNTWSACGWITSEISMLGQGQLKVTGVPISHIESIVEFEEDDHGSEDLGAGIERMIHRLRRLAQCDDRLEAQNLNERLWSECFC